MIRVRGRGGHECEFAQDMSVRSHRIQVCVRGECEAGTITCRTYTHYLYISSSSFGCSKQPFLTTNYAMFFMIISNGTPKRTFLSRVHFNTNDTKFHKLMRREKDTKPQAATNHTNHPDGFVCLVAPKVLCVMTSGYIVRDHLCHSC